jgi:hypothetical protein
MKTKSVVRGVEKTRKLFEKALKSLEGLKGLVGSLVSSAGEKPKVAGKRGRPVKTEKKVKAKVAKKSEKKDEKDDAKEKIEESSKKIEYTYNSVGLIDGFRVRG